MKKVIHTAHKPKLAGEAPESTADSPVRNNLLPVAIVAALIGVFLVIKFVRGGSVDLNAMKTKILPEAVKKVVNNPSTKIEIVSAKAVSGLVEFGLKVNGQTYTSYITNDGKILFTSGIKVDEIGKTSADNSQPKTVKAADIKKANKPNLTAYVVANCPYGLQMQRVFKKAIAEAPAIEENLAVKYIGAVENGKITAMHGDKEAQENLKQICIREEQKEKYWPYVSCYMQEGNTEGCLTSQGVDTAKLNDCTADSKRGLAYAKLDFDLANKNKVTGSPTLLVNNNQIVSEFEFGGRNANAVKDIVCASSTTKPGFCANEISKSDVAVSLSVSDEPSANAPTTNSAAGCAPAQ